MEMTSFKFSLLGVIGTVVAGLVFFATFYLLLQSRSGNVGDETGYDDDAFNQKPTFIVEHLAPTSHIDSADKVAVVSNDRASGFNETLFDQDTTNETSLTSTTSDIPNESRRSVQHETGQRSPGTTKLLVLIEQLDGITDQSAFARIQEHFNESSQGPEGRAFLLE